MVTLTDIREKEFSRMKHGYHEDEVDDFLDEIADQMEVLIQENRKLLDRAEQAEAAQRAAEEALASAKAELAASETRQSEAVEPEPEPAAKPTADDGAYFRNLETTLRETLLSAQRIADETVAEAKKKAEQTIADAEEQAKKVGEESAAKVLMGKLEVETLRKTAEDYKAKAVEMLRQQLSALGVKAEELAEK